MIGLKEWIYQEPVTNKLLQNRLSQFLLVLIYKVFVLSTAPEQNATIFYLSQSDEKYVAVLTFIFLLSSDVEYLFIYLLTIFTSFFSFVIFLFLCSFFFWSCKIFCALCVLIFLSVIYGANIFIRLYTAF